LKGDLVPFAAYKTVHIFGALLLFMALGGSAAMQTVARDRVPAGLRRLLGALHGTALLLLLVAGFGMMARLGLMAQWPPWIFLKIVVWLLLGGSVALQRRLGAWNQAFFVILPLLGLLAAAAAIYHLGS
jgi:hypothetical protein